MAKTGRLAGKTALITGSARGTGEATARLFVEQGARVVVADLLDDLAKRVAQEIGEDAFALHLDVTSETDWQAAIAATLDRFAALDVLVNNAGVLHLAAIEDTALADFERVVRVNQIGTFLGIKSASGPMKRAGRGSIVNVSSIDGLQAQNGLMAYASSKWAVRGMTRVAALELGRFGIRVNAVCPEAGSAAMIAPYIPAGIDLEMVAAQGQPNLSTQKDRTIQDRIGDVARMIAFLASDEAASCTGTDYTVDGGNTAGTVVQGAPGA